MTMEFKTELTLEQAIRNEWKRNRNITETQRKCNRNVTEMLRKCNGNVTETEGKQNRN
jgi:hypothetical protein